MDALLTLVLAASILATMTVLGVTLVAATLVIPAVVARMLTDSFGRMLVLATIIGSLCGFVGMNLSYHLDIPSGPMIVLTGSAVFAGCSPPPAAGVSAGPGACPVTPPDGRRRPAAQTRSPNAEGAYLSAGESLLREISLAAS